MYEAKVRRRVGVIQPVYAEVRVERGLLTLAEGATFSLYDQTNTLVAAFDAVAITGNSASPSSLIQLWYNLDTSALSPGVYFGYFTYQVASSADALNRTDRPGVQIEVLATVETPADWSLSTNEGMTRFWLGDRRKDKPIWSSEEVVFLLTQAARPIRAAALGFDMAAGQESYLALYEQTQVFRVDRRNLPKELRAQADRLRLVDDTEVQGAVSGIAGSVDPCVWPIFPTTTGNDREPSFGRLYATGRCDYRNPSPYCGCVGCSSETLRRYQREAGCY